MPIEPNQDIKIIVTDDHSLFRTGVKMALAKKNDITIIGEAENGQDLLQKLKYLQPDIILLNINMPVLNGLETLPILKKRYPAIKVIILSFMNDPSLICQMIKLGANAYLTKECGGEEIYEAILACDKDWFFINATVRNALAKTKTEITPEQTHKYTDKETRVLKLLQKGKTVKEIGVDLDLSVRTVTAIIDKLKTKTDSRSTEALIDLVSKDASKLPIQSKPSIKYRITAFFSKFKAAFIIVGIVAVLFIPRIIKGLTPVEVLTEKIHEKSKYKFNGSVCNDGHISHSQGRGTCSWHGGVQYKFYKGDYSKTIEECREEAIKLSWRD